MNTDLLRAITSDEVNTYHRDGVLKLSSMFDKDWIKILNKGLDANIETPTRRSRIWYKDTSGRSMFYDHTAWQSMEAKLVLAKFFLMKINKSFNV